MQAARHIILGLLLGVVGGYLFGRFALPSLLAPPQLQGLSEPARHELVLMVAEIYQHRGDLQEAHTWLLRLGDDPAALVDQALQAARQRDASPRELQALLTLRQALEALPPLPEPPP